MNKPRYPPPHWNNDPFPNARFIRRIADYDLWNLGPPHRTDYALVGLRSLKPVSAQFERQTFIIANPDGFLGTIAGPAPENLLTPAGLCQLYAAIERDTDVSLTTTNQTNGDTHV